MNGLHSSFYSSFYHHHHHHSSYYYHSYYLMEVGNECITHGELITGEDEELGLTRDVMVTR